MGRNICETSKFQFEFGVYCVQKNKRVESMLEVEMEGKEKGGRTHRENMVLLLAGTTATRCG